MQALREAGWAEGETLELMGAGIEFGRMRLQLASTIEAKIKTKREELEASLPPERDELLAAFDYKYRQVSIYPLSTEQLVLPSVFAQHLGIPRMESGEVLLEVIGETIELLSAQYAAERQRKLNEKISID